MPESQAAAQAAQPLSPPPQTAPDTTAAPPAATPDAASAGGEPAKPPSLSERAAFNRAQAALRQQRKALPQQLAAIEQRSNEQITALTQQITETRAEIAKRDAELAKYRDNPIEAIEDPEKRAAAIRKYALSGTPEAKLEAELAALRKGLEDERTERQKLIDERNKEREEQQAAGERQTAAQVAQHESAALQGFVASVTAATREVDGVKRPAYPHLLAEYSPSEIRAEAAKISAWAKSLEVRDPKTGQVRKGQTYTFEEVATFLETQAKKVYEEREGRRKSLLAPQGAPVSPTAKRTGRAQAIRATATVQQGPGNTAPKRSPVRERILTRAEEAAEDLAALRRARAQDEAAKSRK